jgi:hypothetical protein
MDAHEVSIGMDYPGASRRERGPVPLAVKLKGRHSGWNRREPEPEPEVVNSEELQVASDSEAMAVDASGHAGGLSLGSESRRVPPSRHALPAAVAPGRLLARGDPVVEACADVIVANSPPDLLKALRVRDSDSESDGLEGGHAAPWRRERL